MTEEKISAPHWRRRTKSIHMPTDQAARQGDITRMAILSLGKDAAIAFLNTQLPELGGRPLAVATASEAGAVQVRSMLKDRAPDQGEDARQDAAMRSDGTILA